MKNTIKGQSSKSSVEINFYELLNKYFFLLFGITYLSIVSITTMSWNPLCSLNGYSWESTSSNSLDNTSLALENSNTSLRWFYTFIILCCSGTPWLLAYLFRHRAFLITKKNLRLYPSASKTQNLKQKQISTPILSTPRISKSNNSGLSYRISSFKYSPKIRNSLSNNTKNIRLPFEKLK